MREGGRVRLAGSILLYLASVAGNDYGVPIEIKLWDTGRTPLAHMVDVTNGFGLKVLAEHNFLNDNNIAFSPYGLMGILVALYEGVHGESSYQIQTGMQLPWNRNVMRIGFRDIHRTLKTYFVPEEGFLAGLALNNENVTFNESYKKILRFYGFDLDNEQLPTLAPTNGTNETNTTPAASTATNTGDAATTVAMTPENIPAREETTPNPNAETLSDIDIRIRTTTTVSPSSAPNAESTTVDLTAPSTAQDTAIQDTTSVTTESITRTSAITTEQTTTTVDMTTTMSTNAETTSTTSATETETIGPLTSPTSAAALTDEPTVNNEVDVSTTPEMTSTAAVSTAVDPSTVTTTTDNTQTQSTESPTSSATGTQETEEVSMSTTDMTTVQDVTTTLVEGSTLETLERRKKSIVDFIFTSPPYVDDYLFYRSYDIPILPESPNPNFDNPMFLANGLRNVQVEYMHYDTILEHAYLPHLEASALRLPLDSERYYLLVVLPTRRGVSELGRLLSRMARESDLSDVYSALRPRRVRAIVPSFTVKGHVTLTTDLQKLGIRDVFEPRQRDFAPMTQQAGVYVRSVEQAVSVAIRKYQPDDHKKNRYVTNRQPVTFSATYPFLYFVMDSSIHVALMAGKMVDPLNTRIL